MRNEDAMIGARGASTGRADNAGRLAMRAGLIALTFSALAVMPLAAEPLVPEGHCAVVVASTQTIEDARDVAYSIREFDQVAIYESVNGWYAVTVGYLETRRQAETLRRWKRAGRTPQDAYCAPGARFVARVEWSTGAGREMIGVPEISRSSGD